MYAIGCRVQGFLFISTLRASVSVTANMGLHLPIAYPGRVFDCNHYVVITVPDLLSQ